MNTNISKEEMRLKITKECDDFIKRNTDTETRQCDCCDQHFPIFWDIFAVNLSSSITNNTISFGYGSNFDNETWKFVNINIHNHYKGKEICDACAYAWFCDGICTTF